MKYVELAICKDKTRVNLTGIYRGKNHFVATDGHRMHLSNGLADAEPHYIDGRDMEFPNVDIVMPKASAYVGIATFEHSYKVGNEILKKLKALLPIAKIYDKHGLIARIILRDDCSVTVRVIGNHAEFIAAYSIPEFIYKGKDMEVGINLQYLIDAISYISDTGCKIHFTGELSPIVIQDYKDSCEGRLKAIVMPQRFI